MRVVEKEKYLSCRCCYKTVATADRGNFQMKRCVLRMTALVQNCRLGLLAAHDAHKHVSLGMVLAKMATKSTLSVLNLHIEPPDPA